MNKPLNKNVIIYRGIKLLILVFASAAEVEKKTLKNMYCNLNLQMQIDKVQY